MLKIQNQTPLVGTVDKAQLLSTPTLQRRTFGAPAQIIENPTTKNIFDKFDKQEETKDPKESSLTKLKMFNAPVAPAPAKPNYFSNFASMRKEEPKV
jgi:hypothetical protein